MDTGEVMKMIHEKIESFGKPITNRKVLHLSCPHCGKPVDIVEDVRIVHNIDDNFVLETVWKVDVKLQRGDEDATE
jgi:hypothetical protein